MPTEVAVDPALYETVPNEQLALVGNPARLRELGWQPRHTLSATLGALLEDYRLRERTQ